MKLYVIYIDDVDPQIVLVFLVYCSERRGWYVSYQQYLRKIYLVSVSYACITL